MVFQNLISNLCVSLLIIVSSNTICSLTLAHSHHHNHEKPHNKYSLFIFGDSILDVGNNNYINTSTLDQANFWPYGVTSFHFPTGRFSDGRLISDFIAERVNLPLIPAFLQPYQPHLHRHGVNFASAGAGALVQTFQGYVIDLHMQLRNYKHVAKGLKNKYGRGKARMKLMKAVNLFSIGTNDYLSLFLTNSTRLSSYSKPQYVDMVIGNLTTIIHEIYKAGGRKLAFLNLPAIGCAPQLRISMPNGECFEEILDYIKLHNKALLQLLQQLAMQLPGFKYFLYDFYTATFHRIKHPSHYGYEEVKVACCGTGKYRGIFSCGGKRVVKEFELCNNINDHLFWDSLHFTEKAYQQFSDEMWSNTNNVIHSYGSYNIKDLFYLK